MLSTGPRSRVRAVSRRDAIGTGVFAVLGGAAQLHARTLVAAGPDGPRQDGGDFALRLADALRSLDNAACAAAADGLLASARHGAGLSLHLRGAGLGPSSAQVIATALRTAPAHGNTALVSFSASYNRALGDAGVAALANALPASVREVGFVGCATGDAGAMAVVAWINRATAPRMVCIEDNPISASVRQRLAVLARRHPALTVVV